MNGDVRAQAQDNQPASLGMEHISSRGRLDGGGRSFRSAALLAEARGGSLPWVGLAVMLTLLLPLGVISSEWQGSWAETRAHLHAATTLFVGPLVVALGCWQGAREHRTQVAELRLSASRSVLAQFLVVSFPVVAGVLLGYLLAAAVVLLASWPYTSAGGPSIPLLVTDAVLLASMTLMGVVAGRLVRWHLAAPALAVCTYGALAAPSYLEHPVRFLSPATAYQSVSVLPEWWQPLAMICWTSGLAAAAVLVYAARRRWLAVVPLTLAVLAAASLVWSGESQWRPDPLASQYVCDGSTPTICVRAERGRMLPEIADTLSGISSRLKGVPEAPTRFVESPRSAELGVRLPELMLGQDAVRGELVDPERYVWEVANAATQSNACPDAFDFPMQEMVRDWLASNELSEARRAHRVTFANQQGDKERVAEILAETAARERLRSMSPTERRSWLGHYFTALNGCAASEVPAL